MKRYATVEIAPLNAGAGRAVRNFATRAEFIGFWNGWCKGFPAPADNAAIQLSAFDSWK